MAQLVVSTQQIRSQATQLKSRNESFKRKVEQLAQQERSLDNMWDGDANNAFKSNFQEDQKQFMNFYNGINDFVKALNQIADEYDRMEASAKQVAANRSKS